MKVAFTCDIFSRQKAGGISVHFYGIIQSLLEKNVEVCFVGTANQFKLAENNIFFRKLSHLERLLIRFNALLSDIPSSGVDVVHHTYYSPTTLFFCGIPVFTTFHDAFEIRFFWSRPFSSIIVFLSKIFCFTLSHSVACVGPFSLSEYTSTYGLLANLFAKQGPFIVRNSSSTELSDLVSTGPDPTIFALNNTLDSYTVLGYIGSRKSYKNFSHVSDSLNSLRLSYPGQRFFLLIIGGGSLSSLEEKQLQGIPHLCLPSPDTSTVISFYQLIDLLLHPSSYEGFAMTVLESAIYSCEVLASPCGALRDFGFPNIRFSRSCSSYSFTMALINWFGEFSTRTREYCYSSDTSDYSWSSSAKCLLNAYLQSKYFS